MLSCVKKTYFLFKIFNNSFTQTTRKKASVNIWEQMQRRDVKIHTSINFHLQQHMLCTHISTNTAEASAHRWSRRQEEQWALCASEVMKQMQENTTPEFLLSHSTSGEPISMVGTGPSSDGKCVVDNLPTVQSSSRTQHTTIDTTMASSLPPSCTLAMVWRKFPTCTWKDRKHKNTWY